MTSYDLPGKFAVAVFRASELSGRSLQVSFNTTWAAAFLSSLRGDYWIDLGDSWDSNIFKSFHNTVLLFKSNMRLGACEQPQLLNPVLSCASVFVQKYFEVLYIVFFCSPGTSILASHSPVSPGRLQASLEPTNWIAAYWNCRKTKQFIIFICFLPSFISERKWP